MIKNNKPNPEPLPLRDDAPPLQPNGEDRAPDEPRPRKMLSEREVLAIVPFSRATLFRMEKAGTFPRGTYISPNRKIWYQDEIVRWQETVNQYNANRGRGKGRRPRAGGAS
jgi:prophage regulatory protein